MKKGIIAGLLTLACFNGYAIEASTEAKAPFGLEWGQSFEDVEKVEDIDLSNCKSMRGYKAYEIDFFLEGQEPFMPWTSNAMLTFKNNKLISVVNSYPVSEFKKSDCGNIPKEINYLSSLGIDTTQLTEYKKSCRDFENKSMKKIIKTNYGSVEFAVMKVPFGGVIGVTNYKSDNK
ncbi:hypothetical protein [Moellerella wisconsensis]|uniref:Uncharacterized protein n=1 Tax=Moellerella wisconsensis TaxID=158849 RepID=A0ACD3Y9Z2_9GAMM|nr:hypothetical protein [Moellerella wisconsensis]UNH39982.1 hypothetical protein MNY70_05935 [Moellerella wisconsensis]